MANGHANDHHRQHNPAKQRILREGHTISLVNKNDSSDTALRILMLEPVAQGTVTRTTRIILSNTPYNPDEDDMEDGYMDGMMDGASSHGKTNISLADFDPDTFLSSSLAMALQPSFADSADIDEDMSLSVSSTSGSITPRPPGSTVLPPPSPPARVKDLDEMGRMEDNEVGTRFGAVRAMGPGGSGSQDDVCWVSVGGLGRAGIFEGDWVRGIGQ
jgi:peroxin-6